MEKLFDVLWKEILIGDVSKNDNEYIFKYNKEGVEKASQIGFKYIVGFKDIEQEYISEKLFPVFTSRIPPKNRHDIDKILNKLELSEYDEIDILKRTNAKCYTDELEVR